MLLFQEHKLHHKSNVKQNIFLILSILLVLSIIYIQFFSKEMNIKPFGIEALIVQSNSMSPIFRKRDIIIIQEQKEYKIGDIVTYKANTGELITHRIIEKTENGFYTKGDNNNTKDEKEVSQKDIVGKVVYILHLNKDKQDENTCLSNE